jgi:ankyrin repeat protein
MKQLQTTDSQILDWAFRGALYLGEEAADHDSIRKARDKHQSTALHYAAGAGHLEGVRYLVLVVKMDVDAACLKNGRSALHWAARNGHSHICQCLVQEFGAPVDALATGDVTPLQLAIWRCHLDTAKLLVEKLGANPHYINQWNCGIAHWLGKCPIYQQSPTQESRQLLLTTCRWLFEDLGVAFQDANSHGQTPLHKAAFCGNLPFIQYLVAWRGVADDKRDMQGNLAADCAERTKSHEAAKWLRRYASPIVQRYLQILLLCFPATTTTKSLQLPPPNSIRRAYLKLAKQYHPDHNEDDNNNGNRCWNEIQQAYAMLLLWWDSPEGWDVQVLIMSRNAALIERPLLLWTQQWHEEQQNRPEKKATYNQQFSKCSSVKLEELRDFEMKLLRLLYTDCFIQKGLPLAQLSKEYSKNWHQQVPNPRDYGCRKLVHLLQRHCSRVQVEFVEQQHAILRVTSVDSDEG